MLRCGLRFPSRRTGGGFSGGTILRGIPRCASSVRPDGETGASLFEQMADRLDNDLNRDQLLRTNPLGPRT